MQLRRTLTTALLGGLLASALILTGAPLWLRVIGTVFGLLVILAVCRNI